MTTSGIQSFLFRHVEKIVLALVAVFVFYQIYTTIFGTEVPQAPSPGASGGPPEKPTLAIPASFSEATAPFVTVPPIEKAKFPWFHPPRTRWLRRVELVGEDKPVESRPLRGRVMKEGDTYKAPLARAVTEDERKELGLPPPPENLTEPCQVKVTVEPGGPGSLQGDTLVFTAVKPGSWIVTMLTLEDEDRAGVAVMVRKPGEIGEYVLARATIQQEIKEDPLGTVVIRFTAPQGSIKSEGGRRTTTFIEPTRYELMRKGDGDAAEAAVKTMDGRFMRPAEAAGETQPKGAAKGGGADGFPDAKKGAPAKKEPAGAPKAPRPEEAGVMTFTDTDVEAEAKYSYRIRSVFVPKEEGDKPEEAYGPPRDYTTLARFSFAYVGGDANKANVIVYIGPRKTPLGGKLFERIPIGGWVGDVPKEFRAPPPGAGPAKGEARPAAEETPAPAEGEASAHEGAPKAAPKPEDVAASRFVTRHILVDIEQNVFHPDEYTVRQPQPPDALGRPQFKEIVAYREAVDRRAIILDVKRNKLHYLWHDRQATLPGPPGKEAPGPKHPVKGR